MIYPGSVSVINWAFRKLDFHYVYCIILFHIFLREYIINVGSTLLKGRMDLIKRGGERYKLLTADNNEIDTMFIDQRNK